MSESGDGEKINGEMDPARLLDSRIRDLERELDEDRAKRDGAKATEERWWLERVLSLFKKQPESTLEAETPPMSDEERAEKELLLKELRAQAKISQVTKGMSGSK